MRIIILSYETETLTTPKKKKTQWQYHMNVLGACMVILQHFPVTIKGSSGIDCIILHI